MERVDKKKVAIGLGVAAGVLGIIFLVTRAKAGNGDGEGVTFTMEVDNIPWYAAESYQWYIKYAGNHGMVDPQQGIWTPISSAITVEDVPSSGQLQATLMEGPYKAWTFRASHTFQNGRAYRFNLTELTIEEI